jgi:hypothetical protein
MMVGIRVSFDAFWQVKPFDDSAIRIDFVPTRPNLLRQLIFSLGVNTDGYEASWSQVDGPTTVIEPIDAFTAQFERPDDVGPYKFRASVRKRFPNGLIAVRSRDLEVFTYPSSPVDNLSLGFHFYEVPRTPTFEYIPLPSSQADFTFYRFGDYVEVDWEILGIIDDDFITEFIWESAIAGEWVAGSVVPNVAGKIYPVYIGEESRIRCLFDADGRSYERLTEPRVIEPVAVAREMVSVGLGFGLIDVFIEEFESNDLPETGEQTQISLGFGRLVASSGALEYQERNFSEESLDRMRLGFQFAVLESEFVPIDVGGI